jgi:hypothetical protein
MGVHPAGVYLICVHLTGVHLIGMRFMVMHLTGICLLSVHLMGVSHGRVSDVRLAGPYLMGVHLAGVRASHGCVCRQMHFMVIQLMGVHLMPPTSWACTSFVRTS